MTFRILIALSLTALLAACGGGSNDSPRAVPAPPANNPGGPPVTSVITARFDPAGGTIPTPNNLLLQGTTDLTLNIPVANPNNFGDPTVALNALDGWSTVAPWSASFSAPPAPASVTPGGSVRMFKVRLSGPGGAVIGIDRELAGGVDFVTAFASSDATGRTLAIVPLKPLAQISSYMVVLTNGIADAAGNVATPDQTYFITKRTSPLVVNGVSTEPLLSNAQATALEPLRQLVNFQEAAAAGAGIPRENIVLSWVATTQSITPVMQTLRATTQPGTVVLAPTGLNIQQAIPSLPPIADIVVGF
ncbi:MAG: Ig-like domain-containing protein, partial [Xanthomonadaceae bacterium]|nr:Ig-like domain-containing protein [Xanthomonadaceae bacterium]